VKGCTVERPYAFSTPDKLLVLSLAGKSLDNALFKEIKKRGNSAEIAITMSSGEL
jgi:hypothetical protein